MNSILPIECFVQIFKYIDLQSVCSSEIVCKLWRQCMQSSAIWEILSEKEKIPLVEGTMRNRKNDFVFLRAHTVSSRAMSFLGEFVGAVPKIREEDFKQLCESWCIVVEPKAFKRKWDQTLFDLLKTKGDGPILLDTNEMSVPYSFKNVVILYSYSKGITPPICDDIEPEILKQCSRIATKVNLSVMKKRPDEKSNFLFPDDQKKLTGEQGCEMVSLRTRGLFDLIEMEKTGRCENAAEHGKAVQVRVSDTVKLPGSDDLHGIVIGWMPTKKGFHVGIADHACNIIYALPYRPLLKNMPDQVLCE